MDGLGKGNSNRVQSPFWLIVRTSSAPFWTIRSMESLTNVLAVKGEKHIHQFNSTRK